ncbi:MAG: hypothetical protein B7733_11820 [Myxococcales bacterium FL481]|nr:MAG: hypothetical protein B7733_11820 [Myxococcales bacterium FL481]
MTGPRLNAGQPDLRPLIVIDVLDQAEPGSVWSTFRKDAGVRYRIINPDVSVSLRFLFPRQTVFFLGYSGASADRLGEGTDQHGFLGDLIAASELNRLADAIDASAASLQTVASVIEVEFRTFFDVALDVMTDTGATASNLAHPSRADATRLTAAMANAVDEKRKKVTLAKLPKRVGLWTHVPLTLTSLELMPKGKHEPSVPTLHLELDLAKLPANEAETLRRQLAASDWSSLALQGRPSLMKNPASAAVISTLRRNVITFLAAHTVLSRGRELLRVIEAGGKKAGSTAREIVVGAQRSIDDLMVVANSWTVPTETKKEGIQFALHLLFGAMYSGKKDKSRKLAHPVFLQRGMFYSEQRNLVGALDLANTPSREAAVGGLGVFHAQTLAALSHGLGHCGEHSQVGFVALQELRDTHGLTAIKSAYRVFEGDGDHAFLLVNLEVERTVRFTPLSGPHAGEERSFIALADEVSKLGPGGILPIETLVLDAYLDPSQFQPDAFDLQQAYEDSFGLKHFVLKSALDRKAGSKALTFKDLVTAPPHGVADKLDPPPF